MKPTRQTAPGNEKTVTKVVNGLLTLGAEVIYENNYTSSRIGRIMGLRLVRR